MVSIKLLNNGVGLGRLITVQPLFYNVITWLGLGVYIVICTYRV